MPCFFRQCQFLQGMDVLRNSIVVNNPSLVPHCWINDTGCDDEDGTQHKQQLEGLEVVGALALQVVAHHVAWAVEQLLHGKEEAVFKVKEFFEKILHDILQGDAGGSDMLTASRTVFPLKLQFAVGACMGGHLLMLVVLSPNLVNVHSP